MIQHAHMYMTVYGIIGVLLLCGCVCDSITVSHFVSVRLLKMEDREGEREREMGLGGGVER